jgi:DNA polymerase III delta subunit
MIVFLYGADSYRRSQKEKLLVAEYRKKHSGLSIEFFDAVGCTKEDDVTALWADIHDFFKNVSLFAEKKLAVLNARDADMLVKEESKWLKGLASDTFATLFISAHKAPLKPFAFLVADPKYKEEFTELSGAPLKAFVHKEAAQRGLKISAEGLARLAAEYRGDMWGLMTEIDRLALSSAQDFISEKSEPDDFISAIQKMAYGGGAQSLATLERMLAFEDSAKIFNILASFTSGEKKRRMADYDAAIKFGTLDYESALTDFALQG